MLRALGCSGWFIASSRKLQVSSVDALLPRLGDAQGLPTGSEADEPVLLSAGSLGRWVAPECAEPRLPATHG